MACNNNALRLIGVRNFASQTVEANEVINLGSVYRKYCRRVNGVATFSFDGNDINLQQDGIYHITAVVTFSAPAAGNVSVSLFENGFAVPGVTATETITTANTEFRTITLDYFALVDTSCVLGCNATVAKAISLVNTGIEATFSSVVVNVERVM